MIMTRILLDTNVLDISRSATGWLPAGL